MKIKKNKKKKIKTAKPSIMGVKGDNVLLAGVHEGTEADYNMKCNK